MASLMPEQLVNTIVIVRQRIRAHGVEHRSAAGLIPSEHRSVARVTYPLIAVELMQV